MFKRGVSKAAAIDTEQAEIEVKAEWRFDSSTLALTLTFMKLVPRFNICYMTMPPPACIVCPVIHRASSLTMNATTSAISFGTPSRFIGDS